MGMTQRLSMRSRLKCNGLRSPDSTDNPQLKGRAIVSDTKLTLSVDFKDRGHGHGDFGVIDQNDTVIASPLDKDVADRIVLTWNKHADLLDRLLWQSRSHYFRVY